MSNAKQIVLVTGAAGFIGYHLCDALLELGHIVVGLDNINAYYDVALKYARLNALGISSANAEVDGVLSESTKHGSQMQFVRMDLEDRDALPTLFMQFKFDVVCNLAAQAGVRYSIENPQVYIDSNINGFSNLLECCRHHDVNRLVYASSSSVYGNSAKVPFQESAVVDHPISLYAATKKSNELMAHTYSHLYGLETIGLRFFTVYGPWGRPDMALFLFTDAIIKGEPIQVFNEGQLSRDFTYIDDIIAGVLPTLLKPSPSSDGYALYNIGNSRPVALGAFISAIETALGQTAKKQLLPMQAGDVQQTWADVSKLSAAYGYAPKTSVQDGVKEFVAWYRTYYKLS